MIFYLPKLRLVNANFFAVIYFTDISRDLYFGCSVNYPVFTLMNALSFFFFFWFVFVPTVVCILQRLVALSGKR